MARTAPLGDPAEPVVWLACRLLVVGGRLPLVGLAGCTPSDPTIDGPAGVRRPHRPADAHLARPRDPDADTDRARRRRRPPRPSWGWPSWPPRSRRPQGRTSKDQRALLGFLAAAHTEHARALAGPDPAQRPTTEQPIEATPVSIKGLDLSRR